MLAASSFFSHFEGSGLACVEYAAGPRVLPLRRHGGSTAEPGPRGVHGKLAAPISPAN